MKDNRKCNNKNNKNIVDLQDISNYMYNLIEGLNGCPNKEIWDSISPDDKKNIAKELQLNLESFIDLMNHFELNSSKECSNDTIKTVSEIIKNKLDEIAKSEAKDTKKNNKFNDINLKELKSHLDNMGVKYNTYKHASHIGVECVIREMISILDGNDNECMWIIGDKFGYTVFDLAKKLDNNILLIPDDSNTLEFNNIEDLISLISKIYENIKNRTTIKKPESYTKTKESLKSKISQAKNNEYLEPKTSYNADCLNENNFNDNNNNNEKVNKKTKTKKEFRREFLLNHIHELSNEDLLNELKRRLNF